MKTRLSSRVLFRTPVFYVDAKIEEVWGDLKSYIEEASPDFYELIKEIDDPDLNKLPSKVRFTLWKYFNRSKFRATPFGNFAAFSLVPVCNAKEAKSAVVLSSAFRTHEFVDWSVNEEDYQSSVAKRVKSNSSFYHHGDEIRFVKKVDDFFQLSSIGFHDSVYRLLAFCQEVQSRDAVYAFLQSEELERSDSDDLIEQLVELQLLMTEQHPNNIGQDYFSRLGQEVSFNRPKYRLAERNRVSGEIAANELEVLGDVANFMLAHLPVTESKDLELFRENFIKHYEYRKIPLLQVLDPEEGIGYGSFEQEINQNDLVRRLTEQKYAGEGQIASYPHTELTTFLLNKISLNRPIHLEELITPIAIGSSKLPNSFSALVELVGDTILLKSFGGATATALLGRFTLASEDVLTEAKAMVEIEENANSGVLFFDIAYQGDKNVDNVNRRGSIYNYELPIVSWSESKEIVNLNEILVSVQGNEVILLSVKYNKRMVPRLASAYNYGRSDLSVFRFLTELQHQGLQSSLNLDVSTLFPDLNYYPRIVFKNVIINPAKWAVPTLWASVFELQSWLRSKGITDYFRTREGDQSLLYSMETEDDLIAFMVYAKGKKKMYIEEVFFPKPSVVRDEYGKSYLGEMVVNLINPQNNYQAYSLEEGRDDAPLVQASFLPGDGWLYYELYCHPVRSNEILLGLIEPFVSKNKDRIENWFFIRYTDPGDHIRFRMKMKGRDGASPLMNLFNIELSSWISSKRIKEVQLKAYHRELGRYGSRKIEHVERWFEQDSLLVLSILSDPKTTLELYAIAVYLMRSVLNEVLPDFEEQLMFLKRMTSSFTNEHQVKKAGFKLINEHYRAYSLDQKIAKDEEVVSFSLAPWQRSMVELFESSADLFHMHVNRLFHKDQRVHEMIIYEFLYMQTKEASVGNMRDFREGKRRK